MERFLLWAWDRHGVRYSRVVCAFAFAVALPIYLSLSFAIVTVEHSSRYFLAAGATGIVVLAFAYLLPLPGHRVWRLAEQWAAGDERNPASALEATYVWSRGAVARSLAVSGVCGALLSVGIGVIAGATGLRLLQYAVLGGVVGAGAHLIGVHTVAARHSRRRCDPSAISPPKAPNVLRPVITADDYRWFKMTTSVHWWRHSIGCRRDWLSGNDFTPRSARTSILVLPRDY